MVLEKALPIPKGAPSERVWVGPTLTHSHKKPACRLITLLTFVLAPGVNRRINFVTSLTREDIQSVAQSAGRFRRGEASVKLIRSVSTSVEQDGMLFSGKCKKIRVVYTSCYSITTQCSRSGNSYKGKFYSSIL